MFVLLIAFIWASGCAFPRYKPVPTPDAIKGWKHCDHVDQAIIDDYQAFAHQVWPDGPTYLMAEVDLYEDGTGKHAVRIELGEQPKHIDYYLLYDTNNVRIKVIKGKIWYEFHGFG